MKVVINCIEMRSDDQIVVQAGDAVLQSIQHTEQRFSGKIDAQVLELRKAQGSSKESEDGVDQLFDLSKILFLSVGCLVQSEAGFIESLVAILILLW